MSMCIYIACSQCKEKLWVGQGSFLYTGQPETMQQLSYFVGLFHRDCQPHPFFTNDGTDEILFFKEFKPYVPATDE